MRIGKGANEKGIPFIPVNRDVLDKLTFSDDGELCYNGIEISGDGAKFDDYLVFKVPSIPNGAFYNLQIDFSTTTDFVTVAKTLNTSSTDAAEKALFKVFHGSSVNDFPEGGLSDVYADEVLTVYIKDVTDKTMKYFRYRWNINGEDSLYQYGQKNGAVQVFGIDERGRFKIVVSNSAPANATEGMIWIKP